VRNNRVKTNSRRAAFAIAALFSLNSVHAGAGQSPAEAGRRMGPSGPYNPNDIKLAKPFSDAARTEVARRIQGSTDIHMHTDPDVAPRPVDAIDVVKLAKAHGLRAIVLKNHYESTAAQAYLMRKMVPGIEVFGAITLDLTNGGVNPAAVDHFARMKGAFGRIVWFPTYDAEAAVQGSKDNRPFARVSRDGALVPESKEVIAMIARHGLALATGHISPEEGLLLIREARAQGVQRIVVTHAMDSRWSVPQMQEAARLGALIEFAKPVARISVAEYAQAIRKVGPEACLISETGVSFLPEELVGAFVVALREQGITDGELDRMMKVNPAKLLGLPVQ
jgi:uncharacterized protein DUF6282